MEFRGLWGDVPDPEKALDRFFKSLRNREQYSFDSLTLTGVTAEIDLDGFDGAVMKCDNFKSDDGALCVWADHSTVAVTKHDGSMAELVKLTKELYRTARVRKTETTPPAKS